MRDLRTSIFVVGGHQGEWLNNNVVIYNTPGKIWDQVSPYKRAITATCSCYKRWPRYWLLRCYTVIVLHKDDQILRYWLLHCYTITCSRDDQILRYWLLCCYTMTLLHKDDQILRYWLLRCYTITLLHVHIDNQILRHWLDQWTGLSFFNTSC